MKKGFTLLELLIVIGILAILATATVLVLNPAELLKQARDAQRVTDVGNLSSAINLYITSVAPPYMASSSGAASNATCHNGGGVYTCYSDRAGALSASCGGRFSSGQSATSSSRRVNSGGWLPLNFDAIQNGSPLPLLPTDPSNTASLYYAYACQNDITYVLTAGLESEKYLNNSLASGDGGSSTIIYEIGTTPGLNSVSSNGM